ncbi:hypothetical protein F4861DRAFT_121114 [Xylaria intraflava]|nr:hypothetical protein F4861DRAFT_121114 [Xylaria intraflava]
MKPMHRPASTLWPRNSGPIPWPAIHSYAVVSASKCCVCQGNSVNLASTTGPFKSGCVGAWRGEYPHVHRLDSFFSSQRSICVWYQIFSTPSKSPFVVWEKTSCPVSRSSEMRPSF